MVMVSAGCRYKNRTGDVVNITAPINRYHDDFEHGFRFVDHMGRTYKPDGSWSPASETSDFDLIETSH